MFVLSCLLLVPAVHAQTPATAGTDVPACVALQNDTARLACYDAVHRRAAPALDSAPSTLPAASAATPPAVPQSDPAPASVLDERWDLDGRRRGDLFVPRPYKPVYLLPATWTDRVNQTPSSPSPERTVTDSLGLRSLEAKYQISFKAKLWENVLGTPAAVWGAYTQSSRWQLYNGAVSRPFRETNYEPELMFGWPLKLPLAGWQLRQLGVSINHQSNGRSLPLSRSWNRITAEARLERGEWTAELRPWWRISEDLNRDDNPDIADYAGRAELLLTRQWGSHVLALQLRHSLRGGKRSRGSGQLEWSVPLDGALKAYVQWFNGYGESLVDYNLSQNKVGIGISLVGWR
ncbi:MAG: phospholipase A [Rubrivivax sp.]|nr:phospholipase A [Rubrivivax sp.]MDP3611528.1 phospholipase A [Rubrivivax sp.]